jgi:carotenoid 1,2-hydratase
VSASRVLPLPRRVGPESPAFPGFDVPVPAGGYRWWYVDALSDDGCRGLTLIAFIGSVFSPFYATARRAGPAEPREFCAINVALYGSPRRWTLTERGAASLRATATRLDIGPNSLEWNGTALVARFDERSTPWGAPLRGEVRVLPSAVTGRELRLAEAGDHRWWPMAPGSRVEVRLTAPELSWSGTGYLDGNRGSAPLEDAFRGWSWSRADGPGGTRIHYDLAARDGTPTELAVLVDRSGAIHEADRPPLAPLPATPLWRIPRATRSEDGNARVLRTLEDTPFYARSVVRARILGDEVTAMHESLCLDRFARRWVQHLIPYRMRRRP